MDSNGGSTGGEVENSQEGLNNVGFTVYPRNGVIGFGGM